DVLVDSSRTTAMLFMILVGALVFTNFLNYTTMPDDLKTVVARYSVHPAWVMAAICAIYVVLGTVMEELSIILLTVPVFFPLVVALGYDPVWFGIVIVVVMQIGLISPPVGMNMFVVKSMLPHIPTKTVFRGVLPFVYAEIVLLAIVVAFPWLSLVLPRMMRL
ncbi:MAG: TRAP transporter large permease subunit, partial [Caldimonas sp.]